MDDQPEITPKFVERRQAQIAQLPGVQAVMPAAIYPNFLVVTFAQDEAGNQAMTLGEWTLDGPPEEDGFFTIPLVPAQLEPLAKMLINVRHRLEAEGLVARQDEVN